MPATISMRRMKLRHLTLVQSLMMKGANELAADDLFDAESVAVEKVEAPCRVRSTVDDDGLG
jgi:hypothetical protein